MPEPADREFLRSIFLMEAWDTLAALEETAGALTPASREALFVITHRLKGAASLHGFPAVTRLADSMEHLLEGLEDASPADVEAASIRLADMVSSLKAALEAISGGTTDEADAPTASAAQAPDAIATVPAPEADATAAFTTPAASLTPEPDAAAASESDIDVDIDIDIEIPTSIPDAPPDDPVRDELERFVADDVDVLSYFPQEASEHLETIVSALTTLDRGPDAEELGRLFRAAHTLKGAAYVVGCRPVGQVAHRMEDLLVAARSGDVALTPAAIQTLFAGADLLRAMLTWPLDPAQNVTTGVERILARLAAHEAQATGPASSDEAAARAEGTEAPGADAGPWDVLAAPTGDAAAPSAAGELTLEERLAALPPATPMPRAAGPAAARRPVRQTVRVSLDRLDTLMDLVGELIVARGRLDRRFADMDRVGAALSASRTRMTQTVANFERRHSDTVSVTGAGSAAAPGARRADTRESVGRPGGARADDSRVAGSVSALFAELEFDRYDDATILARRVGEIAADIGDAQAELAALARAVRDDLAHLHQLTTTLRTEVGRARLVPIGALFTRFVRQAQEAARVADKAIRIETSGESVEIDTSLIEQIVDPLLHLLQNAIVHGIEDNAERIAAGKPVPATLRLAAAHESGFVLIDVIDDGRGIDTELVREQAVERGFATAEAAATMSEAQALELIFQPGFSTATTVTSMAGRGVGMDVVRTNVRRLNGDVEIETTAGAGTRFRLRLPLTVLVSEALLVRAGGETFAVPVNTVHAVLAPAADEVQRADDGRETLEVEGNSLPILPLGPVLGLTRGRRGVRFSALALRGGAGLVVIEVDEMLHKEDIVIKPLGAFLDGVGPYAGATVAADGSVRLVLDAAALAVRSAATMPAAPAAAAAVTDGRALARSVLLVDDSPSVRRFVGQMLAKSGLEVTTAVDGADALERLTGGATFDVIITDLEMPRVNGYELIESVQRRGGRATPIVVLTTRAGEKHASLARRLGVEHYVTKPVDEESFVRLIGSLAGGP